uniref:ELMO domain-containing protein n=1 Tax=Acrobeloides nanus TaxID=290746 RepID=A0A914ER53_9BILA
MRWISGIGYAVRAIIIDSLVWLSQTISGKANLEYILDQKSPTPSAKTLKIEEIFRNHSNTKLRNLEWDSGEETEEAEGLLVDINENEKRIDFSRRLADKMRQIKGYQKLCDEVEKHRLVVYDNANPEHEKKLMRLWKLMKTDEELKSRKTNQWQSIGFQGDDPATDFRGMGMLGLDELLFIAKYDMDNCKRLFLISHHPVIGFPYAICGITITALTRDLLRSGLLKNHFYNALHGKPNMDNFHQVYCRIFILFCEFWEKEHPETIMDFNPIKAKFVERLEAYLKRPNANLFHATLNDIILY